PVVTVVGRVGGRDWHRPARREHLHTGRVASGVVAVARGVVVGVGRLGQPVGLVPGPGAAAELGQVALTVVLEHGFTRLAVGGVVAVARGVVVGVGRLGQPVGLVPGPGAAAELGQVALTVVLEHGFTRLAVGGVVAVLHHPASQVALFSEVAGLVVAVGGDAQ